jgi:hypothetical protein
VSGLKNSTAHQIVPTKVTRMTGAEKIIVKAIITLLALSCKTNSRMARKHAIPHAPAVYLSRSLYQYGWFLLSMMTTRVDSRIRPSCRKSFGAVR